MEGGLVLTLKQASLAGKAKRIFQLEQSTLKVEAVEIALQVATFRDDAVAGDDDSDGVIAVRLAYRPNSFWIP